MESNWLTFVLGSTTITSAIAGVWVWVTQVYIPAKLKEQEASREANREAATDQREFLQQTQGDALNTVLTVNEKLIAHLLTLSNGKFDEMIKAQNMLIRRMERIEDISKITAQDWSRLNEIFSDIDIILHNIQSKIEDKDNHDG